MLIIHLYNYFRFSGRKVSRQIVYDLSSSFAVKEVIIEFLLLQENKKISVSFR